MSEHESSARIPTPERRPSGGPCACGEFPILPPPMGARICLVHLSESLHTARACLAFVGDPAGDVPVPGTVQPRGAERQKCPDVAEAACAWLGDPAGYYHAFAVKVSA